MDLNQPHSMFFHEPCETNHLSEFCSVGRENTYFPAERAKVEPLKFLGVLQHLEMKHGNLLAAGSSSMDGVPNRFNHVLTCSFFPRHLIEPGLQRHLLTAPTSQCRSNTIPPRSRH